MSSAKRHKIAVAPDGEPAPGKVSGMLLEFAQPLLRLGPNGPPDIRALRNLMMLAEMCWNLPVFDKANDPRCGALRQQFEAVVTSAPVLVADALRKLVAARQKEYGQVPFLISVRVEGTALDDARIVAEARMKTSRGN